MCRLIGWMLTTAVLGVVNSLRNQCAGIINQVASSLRELSTCSGCWVCWIDWFASMLSVLHVDDYEELLTPWSTVYMMLTIAVGKVVNCMRNTYQLTKLASNIWSIQQAKHIIMVGGNQRATEIGAGVTMWQEGGACHWNYIIKYTKNTIFM